MLAGLLALTLMQRPDIVVASFDDATYGAWTTTGSAFGSGPAKGTLPNQMAVSGFEGAGLVNTYFGGDGATGTLTSPEFRLDRPYITFLIGGGYDRERLKLELLIDGKSVRLATGPNKVPGGSEALSKSGWDVREFSGKMGRLRIVDEAPGGWGHINVDSIKLTDQRPPMTQKNVAKMIALDGAFLNIPIKNGAPIRTVALKVPGGPDFKATIELADGKPDWYASIDVTPWKGKQLGLVVDELSSESLALKNVRISEEPLGDVKPYAEAGRGQFHFSPRRGWTNDPNGLVFFNGEYHLFFQHNPFGWGWGNMSWGHAVSKDLVHWEELPIALFPDELGTIFSGSAVVDTKNASGLGKPGEPAMLLFYTYAGEKFSQGLAYSLDGRTFHKYAKNPIIPLIEHADRDPKVIWHDPTQRRVIVLYLEIPNKPTIQFLTSTDFVHWTPTSRIEGFHECPDLFEVTVQGLSGRKRWVLTAANSDYMVGQFDGKTFHPETPMLKGHRGRGFYAAQTFSDVPGRRIQIGWFQTETRGEPFNQSMSIPMELGLVRDLDAYRLTWTPVKEMSSLLAPSGKRIGGISGESGGRLIPISREETFEVSLQLALAESTRLEFDFRGVPIVIDGRTMSVSVDGMKADLPATAGVVDVRILVDRTGLEVFACGGRVFIPLPKNFDPKKLDSKLVSRTGGGVIHGITVYSLKSIWPKPSRRSPLRDHE